MQRKPKTLQFISYEYEIIKLTTNYTEREREITSSTDAWYSRTLLADVWLPSCLFDHLADGVLEVIFPLVLNGEGSSLLAVHQQRSKVDVWWWQDVEPAWKKIDTKHQINNSLSIPSLYKLTASNGDTKRKQRAHKAEKTPQTGRQLTAHLDQQGHPASKKTLHHNFLWQP